MAADHLSRLDDLGKKSLKDRDIDETFPEKRLYKVDAVRDDDPSWFADFANCLVARTLPHWFTYQKRKKLYADLKHCVWEDPLLFGVHIDQIIRRCVSQTEGWEILGHCHSRPDGGHFSPNRTVGKVLELGFYWPMIFQDVHKYVQNCDNYQCTGNISH